MFNNIYFAKSGCERLCWFSDNLGEWGLLEYGFGVFFRIGGPQQSLQVDGQEVRLMLADLF